MNFPKTSQTLSRLPRWLHGTLFFAGFQVISIALSALAARTSSTHSELAPLIEPTTEISEPPLNPAVAATETEPESFPVSAAAFGEFSYYESLKQPRFAPPAPVFPVVWTNQ